MSGGITLVLLGALNLLNREYGTIAPGVRTVCVAANVVMTMFEVTAGVVMKATIGQFVVIVLLVAAATLLSLRNSASRSGSRI